MAYGPELPIFRNRFRLPTDSLPAHYRGTKTAGNRRRQRGEGGEAGGDAGGHSGLPVGGAVDILPLFRVGLAEDGCWEIVRLRTASHAFQSHRPDRRGVAGPEPAR